MKEYGKRPCDEKDADGEGVCELSMTRIPENRVRKKTGNEGEEER